MWRVIVDIACPVYTQVFIEQVLGLMQCEFWVHSTHILLSGLAFTKQAGVNIMQPTCGTAPLARHGTQVLVATLQAGVAAPQSASARQSTQTLSRGLALVTQNLPAPQSKSAKHATHLCVVVISQIGVGAAQSAFIKQPTQAFKVTLAFTKHFGADISLQSISAKHAVQRWLVAV